MISGMNDARVEMYVSDVCGYDLFATDRAGNATRASKQTMWVSPAPPVAGATAGAL